MKVSSIITCVQLSVCSSNDSFPHISCKCDNLAVLFLLQECPPFSPAHCYLSIAKDEKGGKVKKVKVQLTAIAVTQESSDYIVNVLAGS